MEKLSNLFKVMVWSCPARNFRDHLTPYIFLLVCFIHFKMRQSLFSTAENKSLCQLSVVLTGKKGPREYAIFFSQNVKPWENQKLSSFFSAAVPKEVHVFMKRSVLQDVLGASPPLNLKLKTIQVFLFPSSPLGFSYWKC